MQTKIRLVLPWGYRLVHLCGVPSWPGTRIILDGIESKRDGASGVSSVLQYYVHPFDTGCRGERYPFGYRCAPGRPGNSRTPLLLNVFLFEFFIGPEFLNCRRNSLPYTSVYRRKTRLYTEVYIPKLCSDF